MAFAARLARDGDLGRESSRMPTVVWVVLAGVAALWLAQRWLIYFPDRTPPPPGLMNLSSAEAVAFLTEDGLRLDGWFVQPTAPPTGQTVIVFNGNAGHRGHRAPLAARLAASGFACLLFDYRGYGGNPGLPSERGLTRDARAALLAVASRDDVDPARIVYYGESLGAAVAVRLAVEHPPHALILRSPFTSLADIGQWHYPFLPVRWLLRDRYPAGALLASVRAPLLVIAGRSDRIVPPEMSEDVYALAVEPKWLILVDGAGHNDQALAGGPELVRAVATFLRSLRQ